MATNNSQLKNQIIPTNTARTATDVNTPYSFQDWKKIHNTVIPNQEYELYNQYLVDWFTRKKEQRIDFNTQLRIDYLNLLKQLQLFLTTEEKENWYNNIDLNSEKEVLLAIPFFAKKLKEIAIYYLKIREEIKKTKIKYNLTGTSSGLIQQLQEQLLAAFTKKPNSYTTIPATIWSSIPELSSVKDSLTIEVEELYDDQQYFDRSPSLPVSAYFNLSSDASLKYFTSKGLNLSASEWIFKTDSFFTNITELTSQLSAANAQDPLNFLQYANDVLTKYLGNEKYTSTFLGLSTKLDFYEVDIQAGDNFFYWPHGPYKKDIELVTRYKELPLSAAGIEDLGTSGLTLEQADTIFVKTNEGVKGAWLSYIPFYETTKKVSTYIEGNSKTTFKYPFPGYGLSGENFDWTGPSLTYTSEFVYLDPVIKKGIEAEYWNFNTNVSSTTPLRINDTTLIDAGSYANTEYELADKLKIWPIPPAPDSSTYSGNTIEAWLYKMLKTDIPIAGNPQVRVDNTLLWPYGRVDPSQPFPDYFPTNISTVCQSLPLSSIELPYSVASDTLTGDMIFKISNYQDSADFATEAAWLYNTNTNYRDNFEKIKQDSFSIVFFPQTYTQFIWTGEDNTELENVFKTYQHQTDCLFFNTLSAVPDQHPLCTCGQVTFTPFGHPGSLFTENNQHADFIIEDTQFPQSFDLNTWKDVNGTDFTSSSYFAWYQTTNNKTGWGYGRWRTGNGLTDNKFYLRTGKRYIYYRANTRLLDSAIQPFPQLVIRYPFNTKTSVWKKAIRNESGTWVATNSATDMIINAGDFLIYSKAPITVHNYNFTTQQLAYTAVNTGSIWSNYDFISVGEDNNGQEPVVVVSYPLQTTLTPQPVNLASFASKKLTKKQQKKLNQYPTIAQTDLLAVSAWILTTPEITGNDSQTYVIKNTLNFSFTPLVTGLYDVRAIVITSADISQINLDTQISRIVNVSAKPLTGVYYANTIPSITAVNFTTTVSSISTIYTPSPGFVINTPLYGWNYSLNVPQINTLGARPYWAVGFNDKNIVTQFKGINSWGAPLRLVDGHNIVSQPYISNITIDSGNYVEYDRRYPTSFIWDQETDFFVEINKNQWNTLQFNTSAAANLDFILNNLKYELIVSSTNIPSNLSLTNVVNNFPVEVYYYALNPFIWSVSAEPEITETILNTLTSILVIEPTQLWNNIPNRYFPTIALYPSVNELYSTSNKGGYFTPLNLSPSIYLNKSYTAQLNLSSSALSGIYNNTTYPAGRGLTKTDQPTPYTNITDNNTWFKEPIVAGPLAGTIKKSVAKKYQKFIPYQSIYETDPKHQIGLVLPTSRQSPWGGKEDSEWTDLQNRPVSFTGVPNVSAWSNAQLLKNTDKQLDNWVTDIYGNQYGLYKKMKGVSPFDRKFIGGELWTRKNSQYVSPANISLTGVFDTYDNTALQKELLGTGIEKIDMFFDTLYVQTSGCILFEKIVYDYDDAEIYSITDDARFLSLALPISASIQREMQNTTLSSYTFAKAGETWFLPQEKLVFISVCGLSGGFVIPELYRLNLLNRDFLKVFPKLTEINTLNTLSSLQLIDIDPPVLTYNTLKKQFVLTILGKNSLSATNIIEIYINSNITSTNLDNVIVYQPQTTIFSNLPPVVYSNLTISATANTTNIYQISALYTPTDFSLSYYSNNEPAWYNIDKATGVLTLTPPTTGTFYVPFSVSNDIGPTYYTLTVNVLT